MNKKEIIFTHGVPKSNIFISLILFSKFLLLIPLFRSIIKTYLKNCKNIYIFPGFRFIYGNIFAKNCGLNDTFFLDYAPIYIGERTNFGWENIVITAFHDRQNIKIVRAKPIIIGRNVWITSRCVILAGVTIGNNSIIGAGSIVSRNIPANCFAAGNPCRVIKYFKKRGSES